MDNQRRRFVLIKYLKFAPCIFQEHIEFYFTPLLIVSHEIDRYVMDTLYGRQIHPQSCCTCIAHRHSTLTCRPIQVRFTSIYSIAGDNSVVTWYPRVTLVCWFIESNIDWHIKTNIVWLCYRDDIISVMQYIKMEHKPL